MPFQTAMAIEGARALKEHPPEEWAAKNYDAMTAALFSEFMEMREAMRADDVGGDHGILAEVVHIGVVARRIFDEIQRRQSLESSQDGQSPNPLCKADSR